MSKEQTRPVVDPKAVSNGEVAEETGPKNNTTDYEFTAIRKITNILLKLDPVAAARVSKYVYEKACQRLSDETGGGGQVFPLPGGGLAQFLGALRVPTQ